MEVKKLGSNFDCQHYFVKIILHSFEPFLTPEMRL
jgi:hypothetical protein